MVKGNTMKGKTQFSKAKRDLNVFNNPKPKSMEEK